MSILRSVLVGAVALLFSAAAGAADFIVVQSTTSTQNSGLYKYLLPIFTAKSGIDVRVVAVGTGQAIKNARNGDGDVLLVDRAVTPRNGHVVVAVIDGEFVCKTLSMRAGRLKLRAANPGYPDIVPVDSQTVEVWGVVTASIKQFPA